MPNQTYQQEINEACVIQLLRSLGDKEAITLLLKYRDNPLNNIPLPSATYNLYQCASHGISLEEEAQRRKEITFQHIQSIKMSLEGDL